MTSPPNAIPSLATRKLLKLQFVNGDGFFFDYTWRYDYYIAQQNNGWKGLGVLGDILADNQLVAGAIPVHKLFVKKHRQVALVFSDADISSKEWLEHWSYSELLGYLLPENSEYAGEGVLPVYQLSTDPYHRERTLLVTNEDEYQQLQTVGWTEGLGKKGYLFYHANTDLPDTDTFFQNALLCANMSSLAYSEEADIQTQLGQWGYLLLKFFDTDGSTQAFLAYNETSNTLVLAFRGTLNLMADVNTDLWVEQVSFPRELDIDRDVKVVAGFSSAYAGVQSDLMAQVSTFVSNHQGPGKLNNFFITGHSLGGALAVYATLEVALMFYNDFNQWANSHTLQMMTFGAPPVGNESFKNLWARLSGGFLSSFLFSDPTDPVATGDLRAVLPGIKVNFESLGYYNVESAYTLAPGLMSPFSHSIANYITLITALQARGPVALTSLTVYITTGTGSVAVWNKPDTPGTDRDISFEIGKAGGPKVKWDLNNWGNDFESGNTDEFDMPHPRQLRVDELQEFSITMDVSSGSAVFLDNWMLEGVRIVANELTIYDKQNIHRVLGPDAEWGFQDKIGA